MGIDIYLDGYEAWEKRTQTQRAAFEAAVKIRDAADKVNRDPALQEQVNKEADRMWAGSVGYLRSSYNGSGLFHVLDDIYGMDTAAYLFPGDWDEELPINGVKFVAKVNTFQATALLALQRKHMLLPWTEIFTEVSGKRAPDPNEARIKAEAFGVSVRDMLLQTADVDSIEPKPREKPFTLQQGHVWYLTQGLKNLREFGELARSLNAKGKKTFAYISY